MFKNKYKKSGFGLIDFLVLLFVVGLLSTLTLPLFYNKMPKSKSVFVNPSTNTANKNLYKKAYSDASQAWKQLYDEGELKPRSEDPSDQANYDNFTKFMGKFTVVKQCSYPNNSGCWAANETLDVVLLHPAISGDRCFIDYSARTWCEAYYQSWFIVDTNGLNAPNMFGKDRFIFYTTVAGNATGSGIPDSLIGDIDYTSEDKYKCPNPPCYFKSWINDQN